MLICYGFFCVAVILVVLIFPKKFVFVKLELFFIKLDNKSLKYESKPKIRLRYGLANHSSMVATLLILIYVIDAVLKMYKTTLTRNNVDGN